MGVAARIKEGETIGPAPALKRFSPDGETERTGGGECSARASPRTGFS